MAKIPVTLKGYVELPLDSDEEMRQSYGENIGLFATDVEDKRDRLAVEALQIEVENNLGEFVAEFFQLEKVLVTNAEWELDLDSVEVTDED